MMATSFQDLPSRDTCTLPDAAGLSQWKTDFSRVQVAPRSTSTHSFSLPALFQTLWNCVLGIISRSWPSLKKKSSFTVPLPPGRVSVSLRAAGSGSIDRGTIHSSRYIIRSMLGAVRPFFRPASTHSLPSFDTSIIASEVAALPP